MMPEALWIMLGVAGYFTCGYATLYVIARMDRCLAENPSTCFWAVIMWPGALAFIALFGFVALGAWVVEKAVSDAMHAEESRLEERRDYPGLPVVKQPNTDERECR